MKRSNSNKNELTNLVIRVLAGLSLILVSSHAAAQQTSSSAVERFEPVFDIGVMMRPRAGLYGITELMMAALEADIPMARQLLAAGADINETDDSQSTALMWAVHSGDVRVVNFFIQEGANVRAKASQGATALMNAVTGRQEAIAVALINAGADANGRGNSAQNFLESAAEFGMTDVVDALIRNGADLTTYGRSALYQAVMRGHTNTAMRILDAGVDPNVVPERSNRTLLYMASASGERDLVELLILKGADASQTIGSQSPLYAAATRGKTPVAELLIQYGAVPTAQTVLAATQGGHSGTATVLLQRLDLENTEVAEIESLLTAADALDNSEFTRVLLNSASARSVIARADQAAAAELQAAKREHSRLLFAQQIEEHCVIGVWDSRSATSTTLTDIAQCPNELSISEDNRSLFVLDEKRIRIVSIDQTADDTTVALPNMDYRNWLEFLTPRPDPAAKYPPASTDFQIDRVAYLADGSLALIVGLSTAADDAYQYLMRYDGQQWIVLDGQWCSRGWCDRKLVSLTSKSTRDWPETRMIWNAFMKFNPYLARQSVEMVDLEYEDYQGTNHRLEFAIDGKSSVIETYTRPSEHSATLHTLGVNLIAGGKPARSLSDNQCLTSVIGRFILVYEFFQGRFEVTDIGTGATLISDLKTALWLD